MKRQIKIDLIYTLTNRVALFTFVFILIFFSFYLIGNYQDFLDGTQLFLLDILNIFLILHCLLGIYYLFLTIIFAIKNRHISIKRFILCTCSVTFSLILLFSIKVLRALM